MFANPTDLPTETLRHRLAALNRSPLARADVAAERAAIVRELRARNANATSNAPEHGGE